MNIDPHIQAFAARVAFCCNVVRSSFTAEELAWIEAEYYLGGMPADVAYDIETTRKRANPVKSED